MEQIRNTPVWRGAEACGRERRKSVRGGGTGGELRSRGGRKKGGKYDGDKRRGEIERKEVENVRERPYRGVEKERMEWGE